MGDSPASYIRLVQHLIEKCIIFNMSREECMEALFKHANIKPVITSTVWKELEKENKEFFEAYERSRGEKEEREMAETDSERIQKMLWDLNHSGHPQPEDTTTTTSSNLTKSQLGS